jgi:hypothetical protein
MSVSTNVIGGLVLEYLGTDNLNSGMRNTLCRVNSLLMYEVVSKSFQIDLITK